MSDQSRHKGACSWVSGRPDSERRGAFCWATMYNRRNGSHDLSFIISGFRPYSVPWRASIKCTCHCFLLPQASVATGMDDQMISWRWSIAHRRIIRNLRLKVGYTHQFSIYRLRTGHRRLAPPASEETWDSIQQLFANVGSTTKRLNTFCRPAPLWHVDSTLGRSRRPSRPSFGAQRMTCREWPMLCIATVWEYRWSLPNAGEVGYIRRLLRHDISTPAVRGRINAFQSPWLVESHIGWKDPLNTQQAI
jgi:hypothetical protein